MLAVKRHDHLIRDIREMEAGWVKATAPKFGVSEYTDPTGRKLPQYVLNKRECLYIATKFNDEARAKLILRWEELENEKLDLQKPDVLIRLLLYTVSRNFQFELPVLGNCVLKKYF